MNAVVLAVVAAAAVFAIAGAWQAVGVAAITAPRSGDKDGVQTLGLDMDSIAGGMLGNPVKDNDPGVGANALTCDMCKKILPYVGKHECASKCSGWWSFTRAACTDVCDLLVKYLPAKDPCIAAGYCDL